MAIQTRPATEEYRKNYPFKDKFEERVDEALDFVFNPNPPETITRAERKFIVAPSLPDARRIYMMNLGHKGADTKEAAERDRSDPKDEIWQVELRIECVRR